LSFRARSQQPGAKRQTGRGLLANAELEQLPRLVGPLARPGADLAAAAAYPRRQAARQDVP
jgi:hypothetical protein